MDQLGQNLNRYYTDTDPLLQPAIFAAKSLTDHFAAVGKLSVYLDFHAHASKRGCFIYGNVLDTAEDQIQNQLYCKLIALNSAHFDYEGCLFSKDHMTRIDPGDQAKGLTAEGSGRVSMYLAHGLVHSYTIECNYNTSRVGNEIAPCDNDPGGECVTSPSAFTTCPDKYTPSIFAGVGRACIIALLDIRGHNPCSRIAKSKFKTLDRVRNSVMMEVRSRREYIGKAINRDRRRTVVAQERKLGPGEVAVSSDELCWRRVVESAELAGLAAGQGNNNNSSANGSVKANNGIGGGGGGGDSSATDRSNEIFFIPMKEARRRRPVSSTTAASDAQGNIGGSNNSSRSATPRGTSSTNTSSNVTPSPLRNTSLKSAPPMPPKVTLHVGDNTCLPVNAFTTHLGRRTTVSASGTVGMPGLNLQELNRDASSGRLSSASPFGLDRPDSRSSTTSLHYGSGGGAGGGSGGGSGGLSPALNLPSLHGSAGNGGGGSIGGLTGQSTPLLCPTGKRITPTAPPPQHQHQQHGGTSSAATVASSGGASSSTGTHTSKVGRNILGKKLHAAGVALLMGNNINATATSLSSNALDDLEQAQPHSQHPQNHQHYPHKNDSRAGDSIDSLSQAHQQQLRPASNAPPSNMRPLSAGQRSPRAQRETAFFVSTATTAAQGIAVEEDFAFMSLDSQQNLPVPSPHTIRRQHSSGAFLGSKVMSPVKSIRSPVNKSPKD